MNKRISKKLAKMATVREFTVQEAWDKVAHHLATEHPMFAACYFIDENNGKLRIHNSGAYRMIETTRTYDELKGMKPVKTETEWPLWEHKIKPEEVTFYCEGCKEEITVADSVDNDGMCHKCNEGQNEMWAKELKHEDYEYRNMKL